MSKSCNNCELQSMCTIYQSTYKTVLDHLKLHNLTTDVNDNGKTNGSWMAIFKSLANCCTKYSSMNDEYKYLLTDKISDYLDNFFLKLKNDQEFIEGLIDEPTYELKIKHIEQYIDMDDEDHKIFLLQEFNNDQDSYDNFNDMFINIITKKFGF